jgi:hypothetical protein
MSMLASVTHRYIENLGFFLLGFSRLTIITMITVCLPVNQLHLTYSVLASHGYFSCFLAFGQFSRRLTLDKRVSWLQCVYESAGRFPPYPTAVGVTFRSSTNS